MMKFSRKLRSACPRTKVKKDARIPDFFPIEPHKLRAYNSVARSLGNNNRPRQFVTPKLQRSVKALRSFFFGPPLTMLHRRIQSQVR